MWILWDAGCDDFFLFVVLFLFFIFNYSKPGNIICDTIWNPIEYDDMNILVCVVFFYYFLCICIPYMWILRDIMKFFSVLYVELGYNM